MKKETGSSVGLTTIGIAALFLAGFFMLVVFGAQSYRNTVSVQNDNMESRALLQSLSTAVKTCDAQGAISVTNDAGFGQVLNLLDGDTGYALRFYRFEGALLQEYAPADAPLSPESALQLGKTERFELSLKGNLLRIGTNAGNVLLHLRSGEGGT